MLRRTLPAWPALLLGTFLTGPARADLQTYVRRPEPAYSWTLRHNTTDAGGTVYDLELVSQTWHDITWKHQLQVYQPAGVGPAKTLFLFNTGGSASPVSSGLGMELARKIKAPVAFLYDVPNQPLFGGKKEDALIAETFLRYLKTGDDTWPLLLPMVKSVVKAMDALQAFSKEKWGEPVEGFIVSGASKRGWTSWLAGAADPRVKAIVPMVIDMLNMPEQLPHQLETLGGYSDEIGDYTGAGLTKIADTAAGKHLFALVDPYSYRDKLTLPKLLICGNNDPYWSTDALNLYWDGLKGDKWVVYVPNAGHSLQQRTASGSDFSRTVNGASAFARSVLTGKPMPRLGWKHDDADGKLRLIVTSTPAPLSAHLWVAEAPTLDFRKAEWQERPAELKGDTATGVVARPATGCLAFYGDLEYELDGIRFHLSTQIRTAGTPVPPK
jgi:PhoPQ-activated pathogenicity-related protein